MILADTGFFVALAVSTGNHHAAALRAAARWRAERLLTTWPVLTETVHLLEREGGAATATALLASVEAGAARVFELTTGHLARVVTLMEKYEDLPMDLADASLVICAEETGDSRILSTDMRDFHATRWKERKPFENLLLLEGPTAKHSSRSKRTKRP